jgi:hypothetical protein
MKRFFCYLICLSSLLISLSLNLACPAIAQAQEVPASTQKNVNVTIIFRDVSEYNRLAQSIKKMGITVPKVPDNLLLGSLSVGSVTFLTPEDNFASFLRDILRTSEIPLSYTKEKSDFIIKFRTNDLPENYARIKLLHRSYKEFASLLGVIALGPPKPLEGNAAPATTARRNQSLLPAGITSVIGMENNTLLVEGDAQGVKELETLIRLLDTPIPMVECRLEVIRTVRQGKKVDKSTLSSRTIAQVGSDIEISQKSTENAEKTETKQHLKVNMRIVPISEKIYEIESNWDVSLPRSTKKAKTTVTQEKLEKIEKSFHVKRQCVVGERIVLSTMAESNGDQEEEIEFFLTITPILQTP